MKPNISLLIGTASKKASSILPNIFSEDILKPIILAVVGAALSFTVSLLSKWMTKSKK